jgi:hypothetical protein
MPSQASCLGIAGILNGSWLPPDAPSLEISRLSGKAVRLKQNQIDSILIKFASNKLCI